MSSSKGVVKAVISGDTIVVRGRANNGPPPERQLSLAHVIAPRLARKDGADEPFAWSSREALRKLLIGKEVSFKVEYANQAGREYASVYLADDAAQVGIIPGLISAGWLKTQDIKGDKPELQERKILEQAAQAKELGIWSKVDSKERIRDVKWNAENPQAILDKNRGKPVKGKIREKKKNE